MAAALPRLAQRGETVHGNWRAVSTDILHLPARVVGHWADCLTWAGLRDFLQGLSGVSERPMIIPMTTTVRPQQRYDHWLRDLVQGAGDLTIATDLGVPRSTARGWITCLSLTSPTLASLSSC